jgi:hypothetical protein
MTVMVGNRGAVATLSLKDLEKAMAAMLMGTSTDELNAESRKCLEVLRQPGLRPRVFGKTDGVSPEQGLGPAFGTKSG